MIALTKRIKTTKQNWRTILYRLLKFLALPILVLALSGFSYQYIATKRDAAKPTQATLFKVNGLDMNLICKGSGSPVVILEAGIGGNWLDWVHVHDEVAKSTKVCAYDRLGKGSSQPAPSPQSAIEIANTLHDLLKTAKINEPYILVGHSAGGLFVREYYQNYPEQVIGMVLVDSGHEHGNLRMPSAWSEALEGVNQQLRLCRAVAPFGVIRLIGTANSFTSALDLNEEQKTEFIATFNRTHYCQSALKERNAYKIDAQQTIALKSLNDLPLVVLSRGKGIAEAGETIFQLPDVTLLEIDTVWNELQQELVALSTNSTHIITEESGHFIQVEQPELVIEAIRSVMDKALADLNN